MNLTRVDDTNADPVLRMVPVYLRESAPDLAAPTEDRIARFWQEKNRNAYLLGDPEAPDGFAMTRRITPRLMALCEFYIRPECWGWGRGRSGAAAVISTRRGAWRLGIARDAQQAGEFWKSVLEAMPNVTGLKAGPPLTPFHKQSLTFIVTER